MAGRHRFRARRQLNAAGTSDDVDFGPILERRHYQITHAATRDATTTPTGALTWLVKTPAYDHLLDEAPAPAVGRLYVLDDDVYLEPGETFTARFAGATAADDLELYLEGWWWEDEESAAP